MKNTDNQHYIYLRSTRERIPCTEQEFRDYYRDIDTFRKKQQRHGRCVCPATKRLDCDMDCATCPFSRAGDSLSLDYTTTNDEGDERPWLDDIPDAFAEVDVKTEEAELLDALHLLLSTLAPEELAICKTIMADLSERAAAASLNISRKAYMYRRDKVLNHLKNSLKKYL